MLAPRRLCSPSVAANRRRSAWPSMSSRSWTTAFDGKKTWFPTGTTACNGYKPLKTTMVSCRYWILGHWSKSPQIMKDSTWNTACSVTKSAVLEPVREEGIRSIIQNKLCFMFFPSLFRTFEGVMIEAKIWKRLKERMFARNLRTVFLILLIFQLTCASIFDFSFTLAIITS